MTSDVLRRLVLAHAVFAGLGALLLLAVTALFWRGRAADQPWFRLLAISATLTSLASFASGLGLDEFYRVRLRQKLFLASPTMGWLFERKMHLAFGVFVFAAIGLCAFLLSRKDRQFVRSARAAYALATLFALAACVISTIVKAS